MSGSGRVDPGACAVHVVDRPVDFGEVAGSVDCNGERSRHPEGLRPVDVGRRVEVDVAAGVADVHPAGVVPNVEVCVVLPAECPCHGFTYMFRGRARRGPRRRKGLPSGLSPRRRECRTSFTAGTSKRKPAERYGISESGVKRLIRQHGVSKRSSGLSHCPLAGNHIASSPATFPSSHTSASVRPCRGNPVAPVRRLMGAADRS
jgi:hypothetical protein